MACKKGMLYFNKYTKVKRSDDGKYNFINKNEKTLSEIWFNDTEFFPDFYINTDTDQNGKLITTKHNLNSQIKVKLNNEWYNLDENGNIRHAL